MKTHFNPFLPSNAGVRTLIFSLVATYTASAATLYWDAAPASNAWATAANWNTTGSADTPNPTAAPGTGDVATFNVNSSQLAISAPTAAVGDITSDTGAGAYTIGTGAANSQTYIMGGAKRSR